MKHPPKRIGRNLHFRHAASLRPGTWNRYGVRKPRGVQFLPSPKTYQLLISIGWYLDELRV